MPDKEYVHEQIIKCKDKLDEIMEEVDKADDPTFSSLLINYEAEFTSLYDRWILFYTDHECPVHPKQDDKLLNQFYAP